MNTGKLSTRHGRISPKRRGKRRGTAKRLAVLLLSALLMLPLTACDKAQPESAVLPDRETARYAVLTGSYSEQIVEQRYPNAVKLDFDSVNDAVLALRSNKADYLVTAYTTCLNYLNAYPDELALLPDTLSEEWNAIPINKSEVELCEKIDGVLEQFRADGTLERVIDNWVREDGSDYIIEEVPVLKDAPVLDVAISAGREPMCYVLNGEITGLDAELIERIAYELGMQVKFHDMNFSAIIPSVVSGKTPVAISNIAATEERAESVLFSEPYYLNPQSVLTRAEYVGGTQQYTTLDDLAGKRIGAITGSILDQVGQERWPDATMYYFSTYPDATLALMQDKIDAFLCDEPIAREIARSTEGVTMLEEMLRSESYAAAFPKTDEGAALRDAFNEFLATAEDGKLLEELDAIWFGDDESKKTVVPADTLPAINGEICIASEMTDPPFNYIENGQPMGYEIDLATRFCEYMGYGLTFETANFSALLPGLVSGKFDMGISVISITEERKESICFSEPYYEGGSAAVVLDGSASLATDSDSGKTEEGFFSSLAASFKKNFITENRWKLLLSGIGVTLLLSVCSGILGIIIGFGFCLIRMSRNKAPGKAVTVLTRILQGTPMVVLLMILYYIVFNKTGLDGITVAIIAFGLNFGAYTSEIMLSGISAVDAGQWEAAAAIGYTRSQTFRKVVFPQAAQHFLPVLKGEYVSLVKMTSVVGYVAVQDLTKVSDLIRSRTYEAFFPLIMTAVIYFMLSYGLSSLLQLVEVRIDPKRRPRTLKGVKLS